MPVSPLFADVLTAPQRRELGRRLVGVPGSTNRFAGPAYPFGASVDSVLGGRDDVSVIVTSIANIITTHQGSVPYDPRMGSQVPLLVFEIMDDITLSLIRYFSFKDLTEQEPRIAVRAVFARREGNHKVVVEVGWSLVGDPAGRLYGTPVKLTRESIGGI